MNHTFFDGLDELYHHAKSGKEAKSVQRTPAVDAKTWSLQVFTGRIDAKRQTVGITFTHRPKIRFFAPRGDSLHRFTSNLVGPSRTWVSLAVQNFT